MRDANCYYSNKNNFYVDIASYCNQPAFFKKMDFYTFLEKRHPNNKNRRNMSNLLWNNAEEKMLI